MRDMGTKESIDNIWKRYAKTLKLLSNALDELDKKPKEVIIEKPNFLQKYSYAYTYLSNIINNGVSLFLQKTPRFEFIHA